MIVMGALFSLLSQAVGGGGAGNVSENVDLKIKLNFKKSWC